MLIIQFNKNFANINKGFAVDSFGAEIHTEKKTTIPVLNNCL